MTPADFTFTRYIALPPQSRRFFRVILAVGIWPFIAIDFVRDVGIGIGRAFREASINARCTIGDYRIAKKKIDDWGRP